MHYVTILCAFNFLAFAIVLLVKKTPLKKANQLLGIIFLLMAFYDVCVSYMHYAFSTKSLNLLSKYPPFDIVIIIFFGPLIYWYIRRLLQIKQTLFSLKNILPLLSFVPAFYAFIAFMLHPANERAHFLLAFHDSIPWQVYAINAVFYVQMTVYLIICYRIINKQLKISKFVELNNVRVSISWLKPYFLLNLGIMIVSAPICLLINNEYINTFVAQVAINVQFFYVFFNSIWQAGVFQEKEIVQVQSAAPNNALTVELFQKILDADKRNVEETASLISNAETDGYLIELLDCMTQKKCYLQSGCTLNDVAELTNIPPHILSNIINNRLGKNFFDFINEYRVDEAKRLLEDESKQLTLEAIGFQCGFGSKSSFNKAFKKKTDITPSEYRQLNNKIGSGIE